MQKPFYKSKTFWTNFAGLLAGFTLFVLGEIESGAVLTGASLVNMLLRYITKEPIVIR